MHRWFHLLGALALVLTLWTACPASAADACQPVTVSTDSAGHFAGDKDEVPSDQHRGAPHHHVSCGEHAAAAWRDVAASPLAPQTAAPELARFRSVLSGREPDTQIRPPIA